MLTFHESADLHPYPFLLIHSNTDLWVEHTSVLLFLSASKMWPAKGVLFLWPILEVMADILYKNLFAFWENWSQEKVLLKLADKKIISQKRCSLEKKMVIASVFSTGILYTKWHLKTFLSKTKLLLLIEKKVNKFDRKGPRWMILLFFTTSKY